MSGIIFNTLEHRYLADKGYQNVRHIFRNNSIPLADKDSAFLHGFIFVILVLLVINLGAALLSVAKKEGAVLDAEAAKEFDGI